MALSLHHRARPRSADPWLFRGGFLAVDLATIMVIAAVTHRGCARRAPPRHPDARLRRHPLLRAVPVPLADLRDHPRRRRQPACRSPSSPRRWCSRWSSPRRRTASSRPRSAINRSAPPSVGSATVTSHETRRLVAIGAVGVVALVGFAGVSLATASLRPSDFAASQAAGEQAVTDIAAAPTTLATVAPTAPSTSVASATTVAGAAAVAHHGGRSRDDTRHHRRPPRWRPRPPRAGRRCRCSPSGTP